jgi:hypothetical protein
VQKNKCWPSQVRSGFFILLSKVVDVQLPTQDCSENISGYVHTSFVNPTLQQGNASKLHPFWPNNSEWHKLYNLFLPKINRHRASRILHPSLNSEIMKSWLDQNVRDARLKEFEYTGCF